MREMSPVVFLIVLPNYFLQVAGILCYSCSSNIDSTCVQKQDEGDNVENCETACINAILSDASLFRGCSTGLPRTVSRQESCMEDLCNSNIFPKDRLSCYQCSGPHCADITKVLRTDSLICQKYFPQDSCYLDVWSEFNVERGCTSNSKDEGSKYRTTCVKPFCNANPAIKKLTCWECDSHLAEEVACKLGREDEGFLGKCEMDILFGRQGFCYLVHNGEYVRRGCSDGAKLTVNEKYTHECEESLCNSQNTLISHCYQCDSDDDIGCMFLDTDKLTVKKCSPEKSSCFACRDFGNIVKRGCGQPEQCIGACFSCWNGSLCNSNAIYECYTCDTLSNPDCDLLTHPASIDKEICNKGCQVSLRDEVLYRGCLNEALPCSEANFCSSCYKDQCNDYYIDMECGIVRYIETEESTPSPVEHGVAQRSMEISF